LGVDAVLFVSGLDQNSTPRRNRIKIGVVEAGVTSGMVGGLTGTAGKYVQLRPDLSVISAALCEPSGHVLWYNSIAETGPETVLASSEARTIIEKLLENETFSKAFYPR